ncbi:MAG: DNA polymerase/3'-5' exonuclease PolX [Methanobacteriaceae archaeon]|jgi:DNA polymerase (family 10)|nr:DNA polymerase/3'-5' exonuclease PolX [Methanobacteriaceae archaeon]MDO9626155.1 DNA polymerase/3'-5' exonuclease PolX [Methanobacteriaceae archaeon]
MKNEKVAHILDRIADFMEMNDDIFRMKAYRKAAHTVETLSDDITTLTEENRLQELPGVGKAIAAKIKEIVETGSLEYFENLKKEYPVDFDAMIEVEGLGPKTIKLLYDALGVENLDDLERHAKRHHVRRIKGMGDKKEKKILENIEMARKNSGRKLLGHILPLAEAIKHQIEVLKVVEAVEIAGSIRRRKESVGDIDILVISENSQEVMDYFVSLPIVDEIVVKGPLKSTVVLKEGLDCDLRVFERDIFGAAMMYFTGSRDLNIELRKIAISQNMKLSEWGLFKGDEIITGKSEKDVFNSLGLQYIPPEMRENRGEIEAARGGKIPELIGYDDIRGDLQVHTQWSDGKHTIMEMVQEAQKLEYDYLAITDHLGTLRTAEGMNDSDILNQFQEIDSINDEMKDFTLLKGLEVDIDSQGNLNISETILAEVDVVVASLHSDLRQDFFEMTNRLIRAMENPYVNIISHPTGRKIQEHREYDLNLDKIMQKASATGTILEINSHPNRLDLRDIYIKKAIDMGCKLVINSDAHSSGEMKNMQLGIATARRGWARKEDIINTFDLKELNKILGN